MVDNFIRTPRDPRQGSMVNYRPDESVRYAQRVIHMSEVVRPRAEVVAPVASTVPVPVGVQKPAMQPGLVGQPIVMQRRMGMPTQPTVQAPLPQVFKAAEVPTVQEMAAKRTLASVVGPDISAELATSVAVPFKKVAVQQGVPSGPGKGDKKVRHIAIKVPKRHDVLRYGAAAFAAMIILALTGYVSIDTWITNSEVKQAVAERQQESAATSVLGEGEDEAEVTPSAVDSYQVAGDLPRVLTIDALDIRARVLPMSVNADGSMQAPVNIFDSGWYGAGAKPGAKGAALIDAHASGATRQGLFAYLDTLTAGDQLTIERGDGQKITYQVVYIETVPLEEVDMQKLLTPYGSAEEGLNLITCSGTWLADQKTYDHRVTVYTERVTE